MLGIEDTRIILCGHSIGAYMAIDVLSRNEKLRKHTVALEILMPFIWWSNLDFLQKIKLNAYLNTPDVISKWLASKVYRTQNLLSEHTRKKIIMSSHPEMDTDAIDVTANIMLSERLLANFFSMARSELYAIIGNEGRLTETLRFLSGHMSVFALYTDNDVWAPIKDLHRISKSVPYMTSVFIPGLTHAFATSLVKCKVVADAMLEHSLSKCRGLKHSYAKASNVMKVPAIMSKL